jgi:GH15 family glucan-1,4-alpha-glucosidase
MPIRGTAPDVLRVVEGVKGSVRMEMDLTIRWDYGTTVPWVRRTDDGLTAIAGPAGLCLRTPVETTGKNLTTVAEFTVAAGERIPFVLTWHPSNEELPPDIDAFRSLADTKSWWEEWSSRCTRTGEHHDKIVRSLITLKALTYAPTGGMVAAPTTSLPEEIGGVRNWDYRYCWLRDATFVLYALTLGGYGDEAVAWRDWLLRAVAGDPAQLQIMYGIGGERRLVEQVIDWLPGYEGSTPVRIGNAAALQFQLDVFGEVMDALHVTVSLGSTPNPSSWRLQRALMEFLEGHWREPDEGIWEVRGARRHFTHSKVMAWVAADRAVKAIERSGLDGDSERWSALREEIHADVCANGFDNERGAFVQSYGRSELDASVLMIPLVGFLPATDPRMLSTVTAIERELSRDGFILRYSEESQGDVDGLPGGEGVFLACSFWLADNYLLQGREDDGRRLFERLAALANDVGLLSEQYDPVEKRMLGNFPQAFSHVGLVNTAHNLVDAVGPARSRGERA